MFEGTERTWVTRLSPLTVKGMDSIVAGNPLHEVLTTTKLKLPVSASAPVNVITFVAAPDSRSTELPLGKVTA